MTIEAIVGKEISKRIMETFVFQWTFSTSPTYFRDRLYLPVLQRDEQVHGRGRLNAESFILCLDLENGETIWRHIHRARIEGIS